MKHITLALALILVLSFQPMRDRSYTITYNYTIPQLNAQLDSLSMAEYYIGRQMYVSEADILKAFIERQRVAIIEQVNKQARDTSQIKPK